MTRILFVCTGNICRSPTAEGVARHFIETAGLSELVEVDSAGTHGYHAGEAPDPRTQKAAKLRGYDLSALRARKLEARDFQVRDGDTIFVTEAPFSQWTKAVNAVTGTAGAADSLTSIGSSD